MPGEEDAHVDIDSERVHRALSALADRSPLVHHLTNAVTTSETANITLHWGGLPVMADAAAEAADMAAGADAVLLNTGTASRDDIDTMIDAGKSANEVGSPVVLDPVGYGATPHRVESVGRILDAVDVDVIKGNVGEIRGLAGEEAVVRGVESMDVGEAAGEAARALAVEHDAAVIASGPVDVVSDGEVVYRVTAGHERMGTFVGSGCMLGSTAATFATLACGDAPTVGTLTETILIATVAFGVAGERAAANDPPGPASYRTAFMDAVATIGAEPSGIDPSGRIDVE